jgi:hypothetical protein
LQLGHLPALPANFEGIFSRFPHEQENRINSSFGKNHQSFEDLASFCGLKGIICRNIAIEKDNRRFNIGLEKGAILWYALRAGKLFSELVGKGDRW